LQHYLDQIAAPTLTGALPMVFVTSWNEWNEDTAIQPVGGVPTSRDDSANGTEYTQGYTYGGEGDADLDAVRDYADVAWGLLTGVTGRPEPHVRVIETEAGRPVNSVLSDSQGWFVLPRTGSCPARLSVSVPGDTRSFICSAASASLVDLRS
jgi:hypothetical protein